MSPTCADEEERERPGHQLAAQSDSCAERGTHEACLNAEGPLMKGRARLVGSGVEGPRRSVAGGGDGRGNESEGSDEGEHGGKKGVW